MTTTQCPICEVAAARFCSGCRQVVYCSREHQRRHWVGGHRLTCQPFRLETTTEKGRCLIATRRVAAGEVVFRDKPAILGPDTVTREHVLCPSCYFPMNRRPSPCSKCRAVPLCESRCEEMPQHERECAFLRENCRDSSNPAMALDADLITLMRAALLHTQDPGAYEKLMALESNKGSKMKQPGWSDAEEKVQRLRKICSLDQTEDELQTLLCILNSNSYQVLSKVSLENMNALYLKAAMLNHSCRPNTRPVVDANYFMKVVALEDIAAGDEITTSYVAPFHTTLQRRGMLKMGKCFDCDCKRCRDPTELGSYSSALRCKMCATGKVISAQPLDPNSIWRCDSCVGAIDGVTAVALDRQLPLELSRVNQASIANMEKFLATYEKFLHPNHAFLCQLRQLLCEAYGRLPEKSAGKMTREDWDRKTALCYDLLRVYDLTEGALSIVKGVVSLELCECLLVQGDVQGARKRLDLANKVFKHEDPAAPEGALLNKARALCQQLNRCLV